ncbi:retinol dehydrogenase 13 [Cherax quadricarinatus]|uniref:retinol dehydrogenase 13 n=1 Tax=Cherax quadricarinatus TaxID=27406 RepID=UPI00387E6834
MLLEALVALLALALALRVYFRVTSGRCHSLRSLVGKTAIITGGSAGIGKYTAKDLVRRGARVILACRNLEKANKVAAEIRESPGSVGEVVVRHLDTSDLTSVRKFAEQILQTETAIHILINNAGILGPKEKQLTEDGLELTMVTNHFGHFLLTNLLLGLLKRSAPCRVINVSSVAHTAPKKLDPDSLNFEHDKYDGITAYEQSKLCNVLFTQELAAKLSDSEVTANSLHPGVVHTEILDSQPINLRYCVFKIFFTVCKDSELGAQTSIYLAVAEEVDGVSGRYYVDCKEAEPSQLAQQKRLAQQLWKASEVAVKLQPHEKHY